MNTNLYFDLPLDIIQKIQKINLFQELKNSHEFWWKSSAVKCQDHKYKYIDTELNYRDYFEMPKLFNLVFDINKFEFNINKIKECFTIQRLQELLIKNKYNGKIPKQYKTLIKAFMTI